MKVKDLLNVLVDGQYVEFNYRNKEGYNEEYPIPMYQHGEKLITNLKIYPFLDREIEEIYSNVEMDGYDAGLDYLVVVVNREDV